MKMKYSMLCRDDVAKVSAVIPHPEKLFDRTIFLTGATGLIGSAIAEILFFLNQKKSAGIRIFLAGRSEERMRARFPFGGYRFVAYDATQGQIELDEADFMIHAASPADPVSYTKEPVETMMANIRGIQSLLEWAKGKRTRVLYISSSEVYGRKSGNQPYRETDYGFVDELNPRACYPMAKRAVETLCASYRKEYGADFVIARPGHIYGPEMTETDSRASAQFARNAAAGQDIVMKSAGSQLRSYCYSLDCASAILTILIEGKSGEAYNISNPASVVSIREIAEAFAQAAGRKIIFENPSDEEASGYNMMDNSSLDGTKLEALGWRAQYGIPEGVARTVEILREING